MFHSNGNQPSLLVLAAIAYWLALHHITCRVTPRKHVTDTIHTCSIGMHLENTFAWLQNTTLKWSLACMTSAKLRSAWRVQLASIQIKPQVSRGNDCDGDKSWHGHTRNVLPRGKIQCVSGHCTSVLCNVFSVKISKIGCHKGKKYVFTAKYVIIQHTLSGHLMHGIQRRQCQASSPQIISRTTV